MAIAVYIRLDGMTGAQYDEVHRRLTEAGQINPAGRLHHSCFGDDGDLAVYNVWESQEAFDAFGPILGPILEEVGVKMDGPPDVKPLYAMD